MFAVPWFSEWHSSPLFPLQKQCKPISRTDVLPFFFRYINLLLNRNIINAPTVSCSTTIYSLYYYKKLRNQQNLRVEQDGREPRLDKNEKDLIQLNEGKCQWFVYQTMRKKSGVVCSAQRASAGRKFSKSEELALQRFTSDRKVERLRDRALFFPEFSSGLPLNNLWIISVAYLLPLVETNLFLVHNCIDAPRFLYQDRNLLYIWKTLPRKFLPD